MEDGLEAGIEKRKYRFMFCYQNAGQNHNMKTTHKDLRMMKV
jgi:hypothetical protein